MRDLRVLLGKLGNKRLLAIFPHPDDETLPIGGLLLAAKKLGFTTKVLILTKGEQGQVHVEARGRSTSAIREVELKKATRILKVGELVQKNFGDGAMRVSKGKWSDWVKTEIKRQKPGVVVTYDHSGVTGHPDHIVLSLELLKIIAMLPSADRPLLLWPTLGKKFRERLSHKDARKHLCHPEYTLPLGVSLYPKFRAICAHESQMSHVKWKLLAVLLLDPYEYYAAARFDKDYKHEFVHFDLGEAVKKL